MDFRIGGWAIGSLCALLLGSPAGHAADALAFGPAPAWVVPQQVPTVTSGASGGAVQLLLSDAQANLAPGVSDAYFDSVVLIRTPQGLATVGTIALSWRPETDVLTVHKLRILRGGKEIDVLGSGQRFTILRREDRLEYSMLSGVLTAVLQPEGLRVGDRLELAYSLKRTDSLLGGIPEDLIAIQPGAAIARVHLSARWPASYPMTWQASPFLDGVKRLRVGNMMEVSSTRDNEQPLIQPVGAPSRFAAVRMLQVSGYSSWREISRLLYPLFEQASEIPRSSPLQLEVARIKKQAPDARSRAEAALRLVQDEIRYVYLGMNNARIVPADVATTWSRRYGDCKAKTVLLLGLLRELGIPAEAVAVSTVGGDALPARLPMIEMFDHVLVRASISGKTYWLDGTRSGDRHLDDIPVPTYRWGLPLTASGSDLLAIEAVPPADPQAQTTIFVDASAGPTAPASFRAETLLRSDAAVAAHNVISGLAEAQREQALRTYWRQRPYWSNNWNDLTVQTVEASFDDDNGILHLVMEGKGVMDWQGNEHLIGSVNIGGVVDLKRAAGPNSDAPYLTAFPRYSRVVEHIKLPHNGEGYEVVGADVDRTIAGVSYMRRALIEHGELTAEASVRSVALEFPASEAPAAQKALHELWDQPLYVKLPPANSSAAAAGSPHAALSASVSDPCLGTASEVGEGASAGGGLPTRTDIKLLRITPAAGTTVRKETVLVADLAYSVKDFEANRFMVLAQFDTGFPGVTTDGDFKNYPILSTPAGKLRFCFPLEDVWNDPDLRFPLSVRFYLGRMHGRGRSEVVARTATVVYPTADRPPPFMLRRRENSDGPH